MFRSKADLILSRYRPIAPKPPPPPPPSGSLATTDLSSLDSSTFASSSGKPRRPRKRRIVPPSASSGKSSKTHKSDKTPLASAAVSFNNAGISASSLTQGNSDATVPRADLNHGTHSFSVPRHVTASPHMMIDVLERACMPSGESAVLATPFTHHLTGNLLEQARMFMVSDARKVRQLPSLQLSPQPRAEGLTSGSIIEQDVAFMDRAAASTVLPDRSTVSAQGLPCGGVCMRGVSYGGGGFTEMIRGITHLPTAADVQSLMQARSGAQATEVGVVPASAENNSCWRTASPAGAEAQPRRTDLHSHVLTAAAASAASWNPGLPVRMSDVEDCTLSLLPNVPSKPSSSTASLQTAPLMHEKANKLEPPVDQTTDLHVGFTAGSLFENVSACSMAASRGESGWKQAKSEVYNVDVPLYPCLLPSSRLQDGVVPSYVPSVLSRDGAVVDQAYLQQVYGGSTDPVLLVDDSNQALWFNKAYDRALKSVSDRLTSKAVITGPYIDPLGHPTPLGSLVLNWESDVLKLVNATVWGFLRKLVMPEVVSPPSMMRDVKLDVNVKDSQFKALDSGRLSLTVGDGGPLSMGERSLLSTTHAGSSNSLPICRTADVAMCEVQGYGGAGKLTTVTLESITEVFMGEGAAPLECVETAEARFGVAGSMPAFITDCTSRVRWVNPAFKCMLGDPEQQGTNMLSNSGATAKYEPPDLTFVCLAENIPRLAWAFSGLVNLEWMKAGKRRSMTVPCDVSRLVPAATWVWKLDVALSLSLNLHV